MQDNTTKNTSTLPLAIQVAIRSEIRPFVNGMRAIHPGEFISEYLEDGQTSYEFARMLNQPVKLVKNILACKVLPPVTLYIAMNKKFGTSIRFLIDLHNLFISKKIDKGSVWYTQEHMLDYDTYLYESLKPVGQEKID